MPTDTGVRADSSLGVVVTGPRRHRWPEVVAGIYAVATALALLAWWLVGDTWWTTPVNLSTFWWSLAGIPMLGLAVWRRRWVGAAALLLPTLVFVWSYGGLFLPSSRATEADLTIATFNTWVRTPDADHVVALAHDEDVDLLFVQEIFPSRARELTDGLSDQLPHTWIGDAADVGGVAVFSRYPIVDVRDVPAAGRSSRPTAVVTVDVDGQLVQVASLHLTSPCPGCGSSIPSRLQFEVDARRAEVDAVLDALEPSVPAVVGGDFNSNDRAYPYRRFADAGFRDPHAEVGSGPGFTWPDTVGLVRIDWVLSRGLEPVGAWVGESGASDHRPVVVQLAFP